MAAVLTHPGWPQGACTCHRRPGDTPTVPRDRDAGGGPTFPDSVHPARLVATAVPSRREASARLGRDDRHLAGGQPHEETHPGLPSTLTQASVSPPYSWAPPPPSPRTWPTPGRVRPSLPPGSMALAGGPRTRSPGRRRLCSWPRGSAHAQLLRPACGTHCRTPVARGLRAVPRAGDGAKRAAAVAQLFPEATEPVPSASAATALRPQQPGAPPPAFRCRSLGNHRPQRYFRVGRRTRASTPMGTETERGRLRRQERALAGRSETWTTGGTREGLLSSAPLRPVNLRPEDYESQGALLPPRWSRKPTPPG